MPPGHPSTPEPGTAILTRSPAANVLAAAQERDMLAATLEKSDGSEGGSPCHSGWPAVGQAAHVELEAGSAVTAGGSVWPSVCEQVQVFALLEPWHLMYERLNHVFLVIVAGRARRSTAAGDPRVGLLIAVAAHSGPARRTAEA
eukprot:1105544-Prymnesium_polylepis.1